MAPGNAATNPPPRGRLPRGRRRDRLSDDGSARRAAQAGARRVRQGSCVSRASDASSRARGRAGAREGGSLRVGAVVDSLLRSTRRRMPRPACGV